MDHYVDKKEVPMRHGAGPMMEETLASLVGDPSLPGRVPSFYDPSLPSYLYRSGNLLIHYRTPRSGLVEFLNLFWSKI